MRTAGKPHAAARKSESDPSSRRKPRLSQGSPPAVPNCPVRRYDMPMHTHMHTHPYSTYERAICVRVCA